MHEFDTSVHFLTWCSGGNKLARDPSESPVIERDAKVEPSKPKLQPPPMYRIILYNDDYTPMYFVVHVLMKFFNMDETRAELLMLTVHYQGKATIGIYPREIAETLSEKINEYSRESNHPLLAGVEKDE